MEIDLAELTRDSPYELDSDMKYIETIDHGAFGTVLHVLDLTTNKDMAVKVINKIGTRYSYIDKVKEEISILRILKHPNIVKFYGYTETNSQLLIKMEYIKFGTLKHWINQREKITEEEASIILQKILSAIKYLHSKQICHRDIKPENIMLSKENDLNSIKIIDFGLSAQNFDKLINNNYCGTYIYMAPELIEKKLYFISVDIWSIGILMYLLLNKGKHPFYIKGDNKNDVAEKIKNGKIKFYERISPMAKHLISKLLEPNPSWRYTASQAIRHPWITRNINDISPLTTNELLMKSNTKKIIKEFFNVCLFLNYFAKKKKKINISIDKRYTQKCIYFDEIKNLKLKIQKEKCLEVPLIDDEDEKNNNNSSKIKEENSGHKNKGTRGKSFCIIDRNPRKRGKTLKLSSTLLKFNELNKKKELTTKGSNNLANVSKKYQINKDNTINYKLQNLKISLDVVNANLKRKDNYIHKIKKRNSCQLRSISTFALNKNNSYRKYLKLNSEITYEKNNEETKIKSTKNIYQFETPQKFYQYLSSKKLINNFPKVEKLKKINLFQKDSQKTLNNLENINISPLILPNLGKLVKRRENHEMTNTKNFIKIRILK